MTRRVHYLRIPWLVDPEAAIERSQRRMLRRRRERRQREAARKARRELGI